MDVIIQQDHEMYLNKAVAAMRISGGNELNTAVLLSSEMPILEKQETTGGGLNGATESGIHSGEPFDVSRYHIQMKLGSGAYGVVLLARDDLCNKEVAIKYIEDVFSDPKEAYRTLLEVKLLRHFQASKYIVQLDNLIIPKSVENFETISIVMELMEKNLDEMLRNERLTTERARSILAQLLLGIAQIHKCKVIHRDLRPKNVLIRGDTAKICDFGMGKALDNEESTDLQLSLLDFISLRCYRAPEGFGKTANYSNAVDIWAMGCIFAEMLGCIEGNYTPLVVGANDTEHFELILDLLGAPCPNEIDEIITDNYFRDIAKHKSEARSPSISRKFLNLELEKDLLLKMLAFDPKKRISAAEALRHKYFNPIRDQIDIELQQIESCNCKPFVLPSTFPDPLLATRTEIKEVFYEELLDFAQSKSKIKER